ncbi:SLC13 family permease [Ferrovibrio terrae]|uniref:SLC13 family permease n=1 Tax=Ferrovibrio terrae TaxID=2594003 RepID=UPI003137F122
MTLPQALSFGLIAGIVALFIWNRFRFDLVALFGLLVAVAIGVVPVEKAFDGFSDQVVVIVASALVISAGVGKSTVIGRLVRKAEPFLTSTTRQVAALTFATMVLSAFMKNIGALAILLPIAIQMARRSKTSVSMLLMPMAFGSLIGGLVTLIGTSPNILVARVRAELTGAPFEMFDFAPVGIGIAVCGFLFLTVGWRLLPRNRTPPASAEQAFETDPYLTEVRIGEKSTLLEKTVADLEALGEGDVEVVAIIRENKRRSTPAWHWQLFANDILVLRSDPHALNKLIEEAKLDLHAAKKAAAEAEAEAGRSAPPKDVAVVEAVVTGESSLIGASARSLRLREHEGLSLLAISRSGEPINKRLSQIRFQTGDVLVLQGPSETLADSLRNLACLPLLDRAIGLGRKRQEYLPLALLALAMIVVALKLVPVTVAFFGAAVLMVALGVLTLKEAYEAVDVPIIVLLACLIPVSDAISSTGGAELIAGGLAVAAGALPPVGAITLVMGTAMLLTPFLNNAATVLIMGPIGASLAQKLGLNPDPFLMAVALGAACDFLTPIGHQCNTLVMGPGGYRFGDYSRLGLPLSGLVLLVGTLLVPLVWPLKP